MSALIFRLSLSFAWFLIIPNRGRSCTLDNTFCLIVGRGIHSISNNFVKIWSLWMQRDKNSKHNHDVKPKGKKIEESCTGKLSACVIPFCFERSTDDYKTQNMNSLLIDFNEFLRVSPSFSWKWQESSGSREKLFCSWNFKVLLRDIFGIKQNIAGKSWVMFPINYVASC